MELYIKIVKRRLCWIVAQLCLGEFFKKKVGTYVFIYDTPYPGSRTFCLCFNIIYDAYVLPVYFIFVWRFCKMKTMFISKILMCFKNMIFKKLFYIHKNKGLKLWKVSISVFRLINTFWNILWTIWLMLSGVCFFLSRLYVCFIKYLSTLYKDQRRGISCNFIYS